MSVKRALGVLACAIAAGGLGSAVIVGTAASGTPATPLVPAAAAPLPAAPQVAAAPDLPAVPKTTLHLPSTLHLLNRTTGAKALDSSHSVFSAALTKPGSSRILGTAAYTCTSVTTGTLQQNCRGALALRKGVIDIYESININTHEITGSVTGGSGYYEGAQGDLSGRDIGGGKDKLTVNYSFQ